MKNDFRKFKKSILLSGVALILSTFSVQAMEEQREDDQSHNIANHGRGTLEVLPNETLLDILSYLSPQELATMATVSKEIKAISEDDSLWRNIAEKQEIFIDSTSNTKVKNQVRDNLPFVVRDNLPFINGEDKIISIKKLQYMKENAVHSPHRKDRPGQDFKPEEQTFLVTDLTVPEDDNLDLLHPTAFVTCTWSQELSNWNVYIPASGPCSAYQDLSTKAYQNSVNTRSENFRLNKFSIFVWTGQIYN